MITEITSVSEMTGATVADSKGTEALGENFMTYLSDVEGKLQAAETGLAKLASGEADNLHQVMLSISKAKTAFELTLQIRNRVIEAYQEVLRMGV